MKRLTFKEIVKKNKLTYKELMKLLNVEKPTVANYMTGRTDPKIEAYILIADYLHISLDELIGREGYKSISDEQAQAIEIIKDQIKKI